MGLLVEIVTVNQQFDLTSGAMRNVLMLQLANGEQVPVDVADDAVRKVMVAFAEAAVRGEAPAPRPPPSMHAQPSQVRAATSPAAAPAAVNGGQAWAPGGEFDDGSGTTSVFGGNGAAPADDAPSPQPAAQAAGPRPTTVAQPPAAKRVGRDEAGYPIQPGGVDHTKITDEGAAGSDEDGVGSI